MMLGLALMRPGREGYYEREIAGGGDDYYTEAGQAPGVWAGAGAAAAGLTGPIGPGQLAALFGHGRHPLSGELLGSAFGPRSRSGFSLSLSAPKGVSVLWALGDDRVGGEVRAAHDAAVTATVAFLDAHASFSRVGRGGRLQVDTEGLLAAVYVHRTSRDLDPQLHSHVLVANKVRCADGKWRALDGREVFAVQTAAGGVYRAALRAELTTRLGVAWTAVDAKGLSDIVGVPDDLVAAFSTRSRTVRAAAGVRRADLEAAKGRALTDAEWAGVLQAAALKTRRAKSLHGLTTDSLHHRWHDTAAKLGHQPSKWTRRVLGRPPRPVLVADPVDLEAVVREVEAAKSTFGRPEVTKAVTRHLDTTGLTAGQALDVVEAEVDRVLAHAEVVRLDPPLLVDVPDGMRRADGMGMELRHGAARFTTRGTLTAEATVLDLAGAGSTTATVEAFGIEVACAVADLGPDQTAAVHHACATPTQIVCLIGPAGAGKSRSLRAAAAAFTAAGTPVTGVALSAAAAHVLADEARIQTETIAKLLRDRRPLPTGGVVFVDEAGLIPTPTLAALARLATASRSKLVLVGDDHQLGSVGAGGLFPLLAADQRAAALTTVRRFTEEWEADASLQLRTGDPACVPAYLDHGRITVGREDEMVAAALEQWQAARASGQRVLVVAADHHTVDDFNQLAQAARRAAGEVTGPKVPGTAGCSIQAGDDIVTLRNHRYLHTTQGDWVANGDRWTVTALAPNGGLTAVSHDGKGTAVIPAAYVAEHVALGYATTIHKAQGQTVDHSIAILDETAAREQAYVAMTRGRHTNHALITTDSTGDDHSQHEPHTRRGAFIGILERTTTEVTATAAIRDAHARADDLAVLVPLYTEARSQIENAAGPADTRERWTRAARAAHDARHHLDATAGALAHAGDELDHAARAHHAAQVELTDAGRPRLLRRPDRTRLTAATNAAEATDHRYDRALGAVAAADIHHRTAVTDVERLDAAARTAKTAHLQRELWLATHPTELTYATHLRQRVTDRTSQLAHQAAADPPAHLLRLIGHPDNAPNPASWRHAAGQIEAYREQWGVDPDQLDGDTVVYGAQARHWQRVKNTIDDALAPVRAPDLSHGIDI
jgi:conjugative relaxase-like TrwC/TraI family protein